MHTKHLLCDNGVTDLTDICLVILKVLEEVSTFLESYVLFLRQRVESGHHGLGWIGSTWYVIGCISSTRIQLVLWSPFYRWGNWRSGRHFQLGDSRVEILIKVDMVAKPVIFSESVSANVWRCRWEPSLVFPESIPCNHSSFSQCKILPTHSHTPEVMLGSQACNPEKRSFFLNTYAILWLFLTAGRKWIYGGEPFQIHGKA